MTARQRRDAHERLTALFWELNSTCFGGILPPVPLELSGRLKTSGGQYFKKPSRMIRISLRYFHADDPWREIRDTLGHEMVHYWLDFLGLPCGHTAAFRRKLAQHGFSRYSRLVPPGVRWVYACHACRRTYLRRRRGVWSCGPCSGRRFDGRFLLIMVRDLKREGDPVVLSPSISL